MRYSIRSQNTLPTGSTISATLFETDNVFHFDRVKNKVLTVIGKTPPGRQEKRVYICKHDPERLRTFFPAKSGRQNQRYFLRLVQILRRVDHFASVKALANAIGANPATLRVALSKASKKGLEFATVRGVSFRYE